MYHTVSDFVVSFKFTNDVKNMKLTLELLIVNVSGHQQSFFTDKWILLRNSSFLCNTKSFNWVSIPCQMFYQLNSQDQTLSTSCIWIPVVATSWNTTTRYLFATVACETMECFTMLRQKQYFLPFGCFWETVTFLWQIMSHSRGTPIRRIYAECSTIWSGSACCTAVPARTKHVQSGPNHFTKGLRVHNLNPVNFTLT